MKEKRYRNFRIVLVAALFCGAMVQPVEALAQQPAQNGEVFVTNDYRPSASQTVIVKWFADKVYYQDGFNVYRKTEGEPNWIKINDAPVRVKTTAPREMTDRDPEVKSFLDMVNKTPYDEFQKGVPKVFVAIKAILNPDFAEVLGIVHYDNTVEEGKRYQYEVRGIVGAGEELVNTSKVIVAGPHVKELPPAGITIDRKESGVAINWQPEELRYYGVYVYRRSTDSTGWKKLNNLPRSIYKSEDQNGIETYPPIFYEDTDVQKDQSYEYRLAVIDYFGQLSDFSETTSVPVVDFEPPLPPLNLETTINVMDLTLTWTIQFSEDLAGFKVYRSSHADSVMVPVHEGLLAKEQSTFTDRLLKTGGYYYRVSAVDGSGNEGNSGKIFIEVRDVTPPAPPQNVFVKPDTGRVVLTWAANTEPDLRGYYVYRSLHDGDHSDNEFIVINTQPVRENSYTEVLPKNVRNRFVYAVVAEDLSYNRSKLSHTSVVQLPDATPPTRPLIKNVGALENTLVVEWLPNPDNDLAGYDIFRSSDSVQFTKMNVNLYPANTYRYTDRSITAGERYFYYVQAVDSAGNSSVPSNIFTAFNKKLGEENILPSDTKAEYVKSRKEVRITWKLPEQQGLLGAVIFKSKDAVNFRPLTGLIKETAFSDKAIKAGTTYYYQVRSYASSGSVAISETLETIISE